MNRTLLRLAAVGLLGLLGAGAASADIITFDDQGLTGPSLFALTVQKDITVTSPGGLMVQFKGGTILTNTANLPADQTSVYGTAGFAGVNYKNPLTIVFAQPVTNFIADVFNGSTITATFMVSDNVGNSSTFTLPNNLAGGEHVVFFAAAGTQVTVTQLTNDPAVNGWDFFIDNIQFNVPLPNQLPEPATLTLAVIGGVVVCGLGWRRRCRAKAA